MHCFAAIEESIREKTKMDITRPPLNGYLSKIRFLSSGEHTLTADGKKFYQHTVTLKEKKIWVT